MKKSRLLTTFSALLALSFALTPAFGAEGDLIDVRDAQDAPIKVIYDTDIGGDIDDAFALALFHRFSDRGVCELLGVTLTNPSEAAGKFVAAYNALNGRPDVPVGITSKGELAVYDEYPSATLNQKLEDGSLEYPVPEGYKPEDSVKLLRRLLANAQDGEVVVVQVGYSTNLAALLDAPGDDISPLSGKELAAKKVRLVSVVGGSFAVDPTAEDYRGLREWNIICDIPAAQKFVSEWPGEIVFSGYEVGDRIKTSPVNLKHDYRLPCGKFLRDAFTWWASKNAPDEGLDHRRPTWDLTSVLFVMRPEDGRGYYALSEPGVVSFDDVGAAAFTPDPNGKRRVFLVDEAARIRVGEAFVNLCSER
ncbi:MAG: nucleoside hydrolase [Thermoguttaceae bacterium]|jgi:inosine-uridine nucleoside N-ribohydrolase|nr:nucleoside hydrolase [Thermoguttaceae bacterium]